METTHESSNQTLCSAQPAKPYAFSRKVFCEGMRDGVPIALGYFAVSFSLGIAARTAGFTPLQGFVASLLNNASAGRHMSQRMRLDDIHPVRFRFIKNPPKLTEHPGRVLTPTVTFPFLFFLEVLHF